MSGLIRDLHTTTIAAGRDVAADYTTAVLSAVRDARGVPVDDVAATVAERTNRKRVLREGDHGSSSSSRRPSWGTRWATPR
ncbi:MAG: hypothetical protein ACRDTT_20880 [Pseudonocardiaceae bacterium]